MNNESKKPEVFMIVATTVDGFIARNRNEFADWTSLEDKKRFVRLTKEAGIMVMGATTFKTFPKPLPGRHHVIYSRTEHFEKTWTDGNVETTTADPIDLIADLSKRGYSKIAICGGENIYTLFLEAGVITHLYLTIEPIQFGNGIKPFNPEKQKDIKWKLLKSEVTENGTAFLDYIRISE